LTKLWHKFTAWLVDGWTLRERLEALEVSEREACASRDAWAGQCGQLQLVAARLEGEAAIALPPDLTAAQAVRLAVMVERAGEVSQAAARTLRYGWQSAPPYGGLPNRVAVERALGCLRAAGDKMFAAGDIRRTDVQSWRRSREQRSGVS
jgi:hypothetical protein